MSVKSVRTAVTAAIKDKKITLAEAENISHIAGRTKGIDAGERREIGKALGSKARFESGAKAHLAANATTPPTASTPTVKALTQIVNSKGVDAISGLQDADEDKFSPGLKQGLEKFASILGNSDGDTLSWGARELTAGKDKLYVVMDYDWDKSKELVGFFDKDGKEVARAALNLSEKEANIKMSWEAVEGKLVKAPIGSPTERPEVKVPANFAKDLEKFVTDKNGDDLGGKDIEAKDMPAMIRRQYEFMERNIPDGVGAEKLLFKGVPVYVLHDYSCVSSAHFYTEDGKKHFSQVD
jgi:hypothetical protein